MFGCGESWLEEYLHTLNSAERVTVSEKESSAICKFGDRREMRYVTQVVLPARIRVKTSI